MKVQWLGLRTVWLAKPVRLVSLSIALLVSSHAAKAQCVAPFERLSRVSIHGKTLFEALVQFGIARGVRLGIELDGTHLLQSPVHPELGSVTALAAVGRALNGHSKCAAGGNRVVAIRPTRDIPGTWLDVKIRELSIARTDIQSASNLLLMSLRQQVKPRQGFAGHFVPGSPDDLVGPFDKKGRTVRELLNLIVGSSKGAIWITVAEPDAFWTIVEYAGGGSQREATIRSLERQVISAFSEKTR